MTEHYGLILDSLIVVLLLATIFYCVVLNRRLGRLRNSRTELERATRAFAEAASRADAGIKGLRRTAEESGAGRRWRADIPVAAAGGPTAAPAQRRRFGQQARPRSSESHREHALGVRRLTTCATKP